MPHAEKRELCVHSEIKSNISVSIFGQECMCGHRDTRTGHREENSQPLIREKQQLV